MPEHLHKPWEDLPDGSADPQEITSYIQKTIRNLFRCVDPIEWKKFADGEESKVNTQFLSHVYQLYDTLFKRIWQGGEKKLFQLVLKVCIPNPGFKHLTDDTQGVYGRKPFLNLRCWGKLNMDTREDFPPGD